MKKSPRVKFIVTEHEIKPRSVVVVDVLRGQRRVARGVAIKNPIDRHEAAQGVKLALGRAMATLGRPARTELWKQYFQQYPQGKLKPTTMRVPGQSSRLFELLFGPAGQDKSEAAIRSLKRLGRNYTLLKTHKKK